MNESQAANQAVSIVVKLYLGILTGIPELFYAFQDYKTMNYHWELVEQEIARSGNAVAIAADDRAMEFVRVKLQEKGICFAMADPGHEALKELVKANGRFLFFCRELDYERILEAVHEVEQDLSRKDQEMEEEEEPEPERSREEPAAEEEKRRKRTKRHLIQKTRNPGRKQKTRKRRENENRKKAELPAYRQGLSNLLRKRETESWQIGIERSLLTRNHTECRKLCGIVSRTNHTVKRKRNTAVLAVMRDVTVQAQGYPVLQIISPIQKIIGQLSDIPRKGTGLPMPTETG